MVLMNGSKRARYVSSITNQAQGGGSKKAGFPYQVGRSSWTSVVLNTADPISGRCCSLRKMQMNLFPRAANISRPIGATSAANSYFSIPGTR